MTEKITETVSRLKKAKNAAVFCHARPDGDAIGSAFALREVLRGLGARAEVMCDDEIPERLGFLCSGEKVYRELPFDVDTIVTVDVASPEQLGSLCVFADRTDIKIDHHAVSKPFGKVELVIPAASAAGEIVFYIAKECGMLTHRAVNLIYAAIVSDTGGFRYSNVTEETFDIAGELVSLGADAAEISEALIERKSVKDAIAAGLTYMSMKSRAGGRLRYVTITNEMKEKYSLKDENLGECSSLLRAIEGTQLAFAIKQGETKDIFRVSMRSKEGIDCAALCARFGGGGHIRAAGCTVYAASEEEAENMVLSVCEKAL